ncbi:phosphoenolpyruvate synthase [Oricola sp.]|uniref:phosphoenolpyruvate synthase n=1 Tax=Oricola sp. TaxID=1979950 RepID=UPI003BAAD464
MTDSENVIWLQEAGRKDVGRVGGKNSSLGEMLNTLGTKGIRVPAGFATTSDAYWKFIKANSLEDSIREAIGHFVDGSISLSDTGRSVREMILKAQWPEDVAKDIVGHYQQLSKNAGRENLDVAVRSSATAEDLPDASFAGQQETYLNVSGDVELLAACKRCFASLFTDRAISYRQVKGFDHMQVALSIGVQQMIRSDKGGSGVMFSIDTETGFDKVVVINAAWGLGENVVQGAVDPDEFVVFKPLLSDTSLAPIVEKMMGAKSIKMVYSAGSEKTKNVPTSRKERALFVLSDDEILTLARWAVIIEEHYGCPMDMEWAKDGEDGDLFIVQARPETVQARRDQSTFKTYQITKKGPTLTKGLSIGGSVINGPVCLIESPQDIDKFVDGSILVTGTTDPDWVPIMKRAAGIITDHGGRTSHAAIVSRELGVPAVVGTGDATHVLHSEQDVTLSCAEGDEGFVYEGYAEFEEKTESLNDIPPTATRVMLNLANPSSAFRWWQIPSDGVGLARMEFVINNQIQVHPMALIEFDKVRDEEARAKIEELTGDYDDMTEYFVDKLARGLARIAATVYPKPVIVRMSDFKTNEYAGLLGGAGFEPDEENPMIGFRGASRYYSDAYRAGFALECQAIARLRNLMGFDNVIMMIPFCRSMSEADKVLDVMAENGLRRGEQGLQVYVMCEIPANVVLAKEFASRFDGFSIGSNDLTQLTLGIDRDSDKLSDLFDEQNDAVKWMIENVIREAHEAGAKVGLCGQAPSDHPEFAQFLVEQGIDSISVTPDSFIAVKQQIAKAEGTSKADAA